MRPASLVARPAPAVLLLFSDGIMWEWPPPQKGSGMDKGTSASTAAQAIKPQDEMQLLLKARVLSAALNNAGKSAAARHRLKVEAIQLSQLVDELRATSIVGDHAQAISAAVSARSWEAARRAIDRFEKALQGEPSEVPTTPEPLPLRKGVPANDNQDSSVPIGANDPVREHAASDQEHPREAGGPGPRAAAQVPERDHACGTSVALAAVVQLGEAIRAVRARSGKSQQDVATLAGVGRRYVGEVEAGKPTSEIGKFLAVCAAVGLDIRAVEI